MATGAKQVEEFGAAVAGLLAQAIAAQKITFRELGEQSGVHYSQLNLMTRGIKTMTLDEFVRICKALTLDPVEIFERAEDALEAESNVLRFPATTRQENQAEADAMLAEQRYAASQLKTGEKDAPQYPDAD